MRYNLAMKNFVLALLRTNLPKNYYYHNIEHTVYVLEKALEIGMHEECTKEELELLSISALWHDTGYIKTYSNHEEESCIMSRQYLSDLGFSIDELAKVGGMIMATKIPQSPNNKLEEILADADLEYLGTTSVKIKADNLFKELQSIDPALTNVKWRKTQISFLQHHRYFTRFCIENREPFKLIYLNKLIQGY